MLGRALLAHFGSNAIGLCRSECDFLKPDCFDALEKHLPSPIAAVINTAGYVQVDLAEAHAEEAFRVNGSAVGELAAWCKQRNIPLIHFSTDYVFDGSGNTPHREDDTPHPVNIYGASKLAGEQAIIEKNGQHLILRVSWLYDAVSENFCTRLRRLMHENASLNVVFDQVGSPTYVPHLVNSVAHILASGKLPSGIYHLASSGYTSRYEFAKRILQLEKDLTCNVLPISSSEAKTPAKRPLNSRFDCSKARQTWGITMPGWEEGLAECLNPSADRLQ